MAVAGFADGDSDIMFHQLETGQEELARIALAFLKKLRHRHVDQLAQQKLCRLCRRSFAAPGASTELTDAFHPAPDPKRRRNHRDCMDRSSDLCVGLGRQPRYLPYYDYPELVFVALERTHWW